MPESAPPAAAQPGKTSQSDLLAKRPPETPSRVFLVPYPKIVFLYPLLLASVAAAICTGLFGYSEGEPNRVATAVAVLYLIVLAVNLVILAFDFPRTTSLTLFFFAIAVAMGLVLLSTFKPGLIPALTHALSQFMPYANPHFYWGMAGIMAAIFLAMMVVVRFDYWEVRPNELLHHHGFLSNLERLSAPNLRIDKEINDVFEYLLLRSGRLILQASNERRAIILDNVPNIKRKEEAITRMLGALQVQVRPEGGGQA
jgi:hypothetical protein